MQCGRPHLHNSAMPMSFSLTPQAALMRHQSFAAHRRQWAATSSKSLPEPTCMHCIALHCVQSWLSMIVCEQVCFDGREELCNGTHTGRGGDRQVTSTQHQHACERHCSHRHTHAHTALPLCRCPSLLYSVLEPQKLSWLEWWRWSSLAQRVWQRQAPSSKSPLAPPCYRIHLALS